MDKGARTEYLDAHGAGLGAEVRLDLVEEGEKEGAAASHRGQGCGEDRGRRYRGGYGEDGKKRLMDTRADRANGAKIKN